jgi:plasmid maintenance system antidote protein VapI
VNSLGQRVLERALHKIGTPEQLARALHIPKPALVEYIEGRSPVPEAILLRAVDILGDEPSS